MWHNLPSQLQPLSDLAALKKKEKHASVANTHSIFISVSSCCCRPTAPPQRLAAASFLPSLQVRAVGTKWIQPLRKGDVAHERWGITSSPRLADSTTGAAHSGSSRSTLHILSEENTACGELEAPPSLLLFLSSNFHLEAVDFCLCETLLFFHTF